MKTNTTVTIYNKYTESNAELYQRSVISAAQWENNKASNVRATGGYIDANQATIYIPFSVGDNYLKPKDWQENGDEDNWTLQDGDYVVKGTVEDEIEDAFTITSLKNKYDDVFAISSVDTMDYGSAALQHWEVGAR